MVRPAERIELITRCSRALQEREGWGEIDFILDQFSLPTRGDWVPPRHTSEEEDRFLYAREMLSAARISEGQLLDLDSYLGGGPSPVGSEQQHRWREGLFRLFLTHVASERVYAGALKDALAGWGVDAFVAHADIDPGAEWMRTILASLHSCDALVAVLHRGFRESNWCEQEVGFALGRDVPCVPVRIDFDPYGFLGAVQAVSATGLDVHAVARSITSLLIRDKRTSGAMTEAAVRRLAVARSWNEANRLARFLFEHAAAITWDHVDRLRSAQKANPEVGGAFDVEPLLIAAEKALPLRLPSVEYAFDQEPF